MLPNGAKVVDKRKKICYNYACVLNNPSQFGLTPYAERWLSGRRHTLGKRAYVKAYRGFESPSLRQINESYKKIGFFSGLFILSGSSR